MKDLKEEEGQDAGWSLGENLIKVGGGRDNYRLS